MSAEPSRDFQPAGFSFVNCERNAKLIAAGYKPPEPRKTGTTIAGIIFKDGVILGADTRSTEGPIVADKNCSKIHYLASNIYCCGAGTAADTEMTTDKVASELELLRLNTRREVPVVAAKTLLKRMLYRYRGFIDAALVLGGVDKTGSYLYSIHPHGSSDRLPYITLGSGCLASMAVFESRWKADMSEEDGKKLVHDAIAAGIFNDLGSGSNIDLCVVRQDGHDYLRGYDYVNKRGEKTMNYDYKLGTTPVLSTSIKNLEITEEVYPVANWTSPK